MKLQSLVSPLRLCSPLILHTWLPTWTWSSYLWICRQHQSYQFQFCLSPHTWTWAPLGEEIHLWRKTSFSNWRPFRCFSKVLRNFAFCVVRKWLPVKHPGHSKIGCRENNNNNNNNNNITTPTNFHHPLFHHLVWSSYCGPARCSLAWYKSFCL